MEELRTKIHATCGPACRDVAVLAAMVEAGVDAFRINGALADEIQMAEWVGRIREASAAAGRHVGILVDLPGTKFRLGELAASAPLTLTVGHELDLDLRPEAGDLTRLPLRSMPFLADVRPGDAVVLGDGSGRLEVLLAGAEKLRVRVVEAARVRPGTGVHFPGVSLPTAVPAERDRALLAAAVALEVDMVAQSFVRTADDMGRLKEHLARLGARSTLALAKIERLEAVENLERILSRSDGLLIGRGDLGIDAGVERVPSLQRRILEAARQAACPAVVATEMLDSMVRATRPTRAEASDVAGAVFEGADGVMLSAETALGHDPALAVRTMARILGAAEEDPSAPYAGRAFFPPLPSKMGRPDQHVVRAAVALARDSNAAAIVVFTRRGSSAVRLSKERPTAPIHALAPTDEVCRRLTLAWGVRPRRVPVPKGTDEIFSFVRDYLYGAAGLGPRDRAVLVMGSPRDPAGATTLIKLIAP